MKVRSILTAKSGDLIAVHPATTIETAVHRMKLHDIGALIVTEGENLAGLLVERDLVRALADIGSELLQRMVRDIMTRTVPTCTPEDDLKQVMTVMTRYRVRHLPVVEDGRPIGIVSMGDVVKRRLDEIEQESLILRDAYIASR